MAQQARPIATMLVSFRHAEQKECIRINASDFDSAIHESWEEPQIQDGEPEEEDEAEEEEQDDAAQQRRDPRITTWILRRAAELGVDPKLLVLQKKTLIRRCFDEFGVSLAPQKSIETMAQDITILRKKYAESRKKD